MQSYQHINNILYRNRKNSEVHVEIEKTLNSQPILQDFKAIFTKAACYQHINRQTNGTEQGT